MFQLSLKHFGNVLDVVRPIHHKLTRVKTICKIFSKMFFSFKRITSNLCTAYGMLKIEFVEMSLEIRVTMWAYFYFIVMALYCLSFYCQCTLLFMGLYCFQVL